METKISKPEVGEALARHERKCTICRHPDREAIEDDFVNWRDVWNIHKKYEIDDPRSIYRHARAIGLLELRRENLRSALDQIVEHLPNARISGDTVLRAIRAYSCLDERGRWTDPPSQVVFTASRDGLSGPNSPSAARKAFRLGAEEGAEEGTALLGPAPDDALALAPPQDIPAPDSAVDDAALIAVPRLEKPLSD